MLTRPASNFTALRSSLLRCIWLTRRNGLCLRTPHGQALAAARRLRAVGGNCDSARGEPGAQGGRTVARDAIDSRAGGGSDSGKLIRAVDYPPLLSSIQGFGFSLFLERMGKPVTLLERLCGHAMSFGAQSFEMERKDGRQRAFAQIDNARTRIANFEDSGSDAKELRANLYAATKSPFAR
jgi:hypothetical protein